jgi:hypothetical protein
MSTPRSSHPPDAAAVALGLISAFDGSHLKRPSQVVRKHYDESDEIRCLLGDGNWDNVAPGFFCNPVAWVLLTQDGFDYYLPGVILACVRGDEETRSLATRMFDEMCTSRSATEWNTTLNRFSCEQVIAIQDALAYLRCADPEFWINTTLDEAISTITRHTSP